METIIGILIPFIGTTFGSLTVYFLKNNLSKKIENIILGFAAGVMVAASIWSLLIPSMDLTTTHIWLPASIGLLAGVLLFILIDYLLNKKMTKNPQVDNLMLAITIHNIPEGMAVGIAFSSYLNGTMNLIPCMTLALGIAIQNFPEGSIVSLPLLKRGYSKNKAFLYGVISALFELLGAIITLLFSRLIAIVLPYLLSLAAGAMLYVVIVELIPESTSNSKHNVIGFTIGFIIMMILDVVLG